MAKTIKDIVLETYPVKMVKTYGYLPGGDITEKDENLFQRIAMEKGANAVLKEIENILATEFIAGRVATDRLKLLEIHSRIKELKGE